MTPGIILGVASGIPWTLAVTAAAFFLGAALGLPLCAMRQSKYALLRAIAFAYIVVFRSVPPLLWVFVFFFGLGSGYLPMSAFQGVVLGLGLITAANMAEIYRGGLSAIHAGQWEASEALVLPSYSTYIDNHRASASAGFPSIFSKLRGRTSEGVCDRINDRRQRHIVQRQLSCEVNLSRPNRIRDRRSILHND